MTRLGSEVGARRISLWLCLGGSMLAAGTFFAALPLDRFGIFDRLEVVIICLFFAAAAAAAGLTLTAGSGRFWRRAASNPVALLLGGLAVWSLVTAPLAELPWRALTGPPQTGQGALMMLGLAAIAAATAVIRPSRVAYAIVALAATAAGWTAAGLQLAFPYAIFDVPGYYAVLALAIFGLVAGAPLRPNRAAALAAVAAFPPLAVSENRSAMLITALVAIPVYLVVRWAISRTGRAGIGYLRLGLAASTVVMTCLGSAVVWWFGHAGHFASITARARITDVMWAALVDRPATWLWGFGWGGTTDAFLRYLRSGADRLWDQSWDMIGRDFHSAHSVVGEFFFSAGIPGLLAGLALAALVPLFAPKRLLPAAAAFALAFSALSVVWYQQAFNLGSTVAALAVLAPSCRPLLRLAHSRSASRLGKAIMATAAVIFAVVGLWLARYGLDVNYALATASESDTCAEAFPMDSGRSDLGLRYALFEAVTQARTTFQTAGKVEPQDLRRIAALTCTTDQRLAAAPSLHLAFSAVVIRGEVATTPALFPSGDVEGMLALWPDQLRTWLKLAPRRTDMAAPYLAWLAGREDFAAMARFSDEIRRLDAGDAVGLWFAGLARFRLGNPNEGMRLMALALQAGFERVMPVPENITNLLKK